jgi:hypothetical protein
MIKLKNILAEGYAWKRKSNQALPRLSDVQRIYESNQQAERMLDAANPMDNDEIEQAVSMLFGDMTEQEIQEYLENIETTKPKWLAKLRKWLKSVGPKGPGSEKMGGPAVAIAALAAGIAAWIKRSLSNKQEEPMGESAKPDFLDLDNDGDKEESMKSAAKSKKADKDEEDKEEVNESWLITKGGEQKLRQMSLQERITKNLRRTE